MKMVAATASCITNLDGYADTIGLRPAEPTQFVQIPGELLGTGSQALLPPDGLAAVKRRVTEMLVPSARASRGRVEGEDDS